MVIDSQLSVSPNPFGVMQEEQTPSTSMTSNDTAEDSQVDDRTCPLSPLTAVDPEFADYTNGLTYMQKQYVGEVLLEQGKDAATNAARAFGIGALAAIAGQRRLVKNEPTRVAAQHVNIGTDQQLSAWRALPFYDVPFISYGTFGSIFYKRDARKAAYLGHVGKRLPFKRGTFGVGPTVWMLLPPSRRLSPQQLQEELPFYSVDLCAEQPWGTLTAPGQDRRAAYRQAIKFSKQLQHELPFCHVDLDKEKPWGTLIPSNASRRGSISQAEMTNGRLQHELAFHAVNLDREKPWGTFGASSRSSKRQRCSRDLSPHSRMLNIALLHQLPFHGCNLDTKQPWGTLSYRERHRHRPQPMTVRSYCVSCHSTAVT